MLNLKRLRESRLANFLRGYWHVWHPPVRPVETIPLLKRLAICSINKPTKLLHIGANNGAEAKCYGEHGIEAWHVEAIPEVYDALCRNCTAHLRQHAILACLSSRSGELVDFNVSSNSGLSSSLLGLGRHQNAYQQIHYTKQISLSTLTVDGLIASGQIPADIDFLVIDAQGAELLILQGAQNLLAADCLQGALIETALMPLYEGGASYMDISSMLSIHRLYLCQAGFNRNGWCDALYSRQYWP